jgi:hypothetical protein
MNASQEQQPMAAVFLSAQFPICGFCVGTVMDTGKRRLGRPAYVTIRIDMGAFQRDRALQEVTPNNDLRGDVWESTNHTFIVKIFLEETPEGTDEALWRGHITHVLSGERKSFQQNLAEIVVFIRPYIEEMGGTKNSRFKLNQWIKRWKICRKLWS